MKKPFNKTLTIALLGLSACALFQSEVKSPDAERVADLGRIEKKTGNTVFVWLKGGTGDLENDAASFAKESGLPADSVTAVYPGLGGFALTIEPAKFRELTLNNGSLAERIDHTSDDRTIVAFSGTPPFADCPDPAFPLPPLGVVPANIRRVGGPVGTAASNAGKNIWIVDSGVDNASGELNLDSTDSVTCVDMINNQHRCVGGPVQDVVGHGTMLAGIIAAKGVSTNLVGVAPGANVIAVKVFDNHPQDDMEIPLLGLDYVLRHAAPGDVVNISWGAKWDFDPRDPLDEAVRRIADRGVKVAVAAGNMVDDPAVAAVIGAGYVDMMSPARSGAYSASHLVQGHRGEVRTASAVDGTDTFWFYRPAATGGRTSTNTAAWGSFFGNGHAGKPLPDFAEPGVAITSLWPHAATGGPNQARSCTGTSFAAPHLAGILLEGTPVANGKAAQDPSAAIPGTNQFDTSTLDPTGKLVGE